MQGVHVMEVDPIKTQMGSSKPLLRLLPEAISFSQNTGNYNLPPRAIPIPLPVILPVKKPKGKILLKTRILVAPNPNTVLSTVHQNASTVQCRPLFSLLWHL